MANKKQLQKTVNIKDIVVDKELYPRQNHSWQKAFEYSEGMKCGSVFPKIVLGLHSGTLYLIDGKHRVEATKMCKEKEIDAIVWTGLSRNEMYKMAVKLNVEHGLGLSVYDKRRAVARLTAMGVKSKEVSMLVNVQEDKLEEFVEQRMVNSVSGREVGVGEDGEFFAEMGQQVLKSSMKHFTGSEGTDAANVLRLQKKIYSRDQLSMWKDVVHILKNDLVDLTDKETVKYVVSARTLMRKLKI